MITHTAPCTSGGKNVSLSSSSYRHFPRLHPTDRLSCRVLFRFFFLFLRRPVHSAFNRRREVDGQLNGNEPIERRRRGNKPTTAEKRKKKVEGKQENRGLPHIKRRVTKGAVRRKISTAPCMRKNFSFFLYIFMYPFGFRQLIVVYTKPRALRLQSLGEMSRKKTKREKPVAGVLYFSLKRKKKKPRRHANK